MKNLKINSLRSIFVLVALVAFNSCSVIEDLEYVVVENPLQMHGGEVTLKINGKFIEKGLNSKAVAEVTPIYFCNDGNEIPFQTEIFQGAKAAGNGKVDEPMTVKVGDQVLYGQYSGTEIKLDGTTYLIMKEADIYGIF